MSNSMATPNRRLTPKSRPVEGIINGIAITVIAGLCVLGMASLVDIVMVAVR